MNCSFDEGMNCDTAQPHDRLRVGITVTQGQGLQRGSFGPAAQEKGQYTYRPKCPTQCC